MRFGTEVSQVVQKMRLLSISREFYRKDCALMECDHVSCGCFGMEI